MTASRTAAADYQQTLREADLLDISDIVDGFSCRVREIFE